MIIAYISSLFLFAQTISDLPGMVPLDPQRPAASDLIYQGNDLRPDEAKQLVLDGKIKDLSELEPDPTSIIWKNRLLLVQEDQAIESASEKAFRENTPQDFSFVDYIPETLGRLGFSIQRVNERGSVEIYRVRIDRLNQNVLLRRNLLRKIGYNIDFTGWAKTLRIRFKGDSSKDAFIDKLKKDTFLDPELWIVENNDSELVIREAIVYKGAEDTFYNLARGDIPAKVVRNRRLFNALLVPYSLTSVTNSVNAFSWVPGKVFNRQLSLPYEDAYSFSTTNGDAKWITKRILKLTRQDWQQIVAHAYYPQAVETLLVEKLISRRDFLREYLELEKGTTKLEANTKISSGDLLVDGRLTTQEWPGHVQSYSIGSPTSPLSGDEFKSLLKSKTITNIISNTIDAFNREYVPESDIAFEIFDRQLDLAAEQFANFITTGEVSEVPFGFWTTNLYDGGVIASREVVTGNYLGTDNLVQLADVVGFNLSVGKFIGADGLPTRVNFGGSATVFLSRTYAHIKPVKSVKLAIKEPFKNILVPKYKKDLVSELLYAFSASNRYELREQHRSELRELAESILNGFRENNILEEIENGGGNPGQRRQYESAMAYLNPSAENLQEAEDAKYEEQIRRLTSEFLNNFAKGESLIVSHNLGGALSLNPSFSISSRAQLQLSWSQSKLNLSRLHIYRSDQNTIQVYRDPANMDVSRLYVGIEAYIPVIGYTRTKRSGTADTYFYSLNLDPKQDLEELEQNLKAIVRLIQDSEIDAVNALNNPYIIKHKFKDKRGEFNFFHLRNMTLKSEDYIDVVTPDGYEKSYLRRVSGQRSGKNYEALTIQVVNSLLESYTEEDILLQTTNDSNDPADTMFGESISESFVFETEIITSPDGEKLIKDPFVNLSYKWRNWRIKTEDILEIISDVNTWFSQDMFADNVLANTNELQLSTLQVDVNIYTSGIEYLSSFTKDEMRTIVETHGQFPHYPITPGDMPNSQVRRLRLEREERRNRHYVMIFAGEFRRFQRAYEKGEVEDTFKHLSKFLTFAERILPRDEFYKILGGERNIYASGQILGFRDQDELEDNGIIGNSVGKIGSDKGRGPLDFVRNKIGITESEMFIYWLLNKL